MPDFYTTFSNGAATIPKTKQIVTGVTEWLDSSAAAPLMETGEGLEARESLFNMTEELASTIELLDAHSSWEVTSLQQSVGVFIHSDVFSNFVSHFADRMITSIISQEWIVRSLNSCIYIFVICTVLRKASGPILRRFELLQSPRVTSSSLRRSSRRMVKPDVGRHFATRHILNCEIAWTFTASIMVWH